MPVLRQWNLFEVTGLNADGEAARDQIAAHLETLETQASRFEDRRAARAARVSATTQA